MNFNLSFMDKDNSNQIYIPIRFYCGYDEMDNDVGDDNDGDIDAIPMIKTRPL